MELKTSLTLLHASSATPFPEARDQYGREPFRHPALDGLASVSLESKIQILQISRLAQLAETYGLDTVIRWKPKRVCLNSSNWSTMVRTKLTFPYLDDKSQRVRPACCGSADAVRYCGGRCTTKGGQGCRGCYPRAFVIALRARVQLT